jgi:hypothetical protein
MLPPFKLVIPNRAERPVRNLLFVSSGNNAALNLK